MIRYQLRTSQNLTEAFADFTNNFDEYIKSTLSTLTLFSIATLGLVKFAIDGDKLIDDEDTISIGSLNNVIDCLITDVNRIKTVFNTLKGNFDTLKAKVDTIKSCDCKPAVDYNPQFEQIQDQLKQQSSDLEGLIRRHVDNLQRQISDNAAGFQRQIDDMELDVNELQSSSNIRLFGSRIGEMKINKPGSKAMGSETEAANQAIAQATQPHLQRVWLAAPNNYVYNVYREMWEDLMNYSETLYPPGWRTDRNWNAPGNMAWDVNHGEWVVIARARYDNTWRTDISSLSANTIQHDLTRGQLIWNRQRGEYEYIDDHDNIHDRNWNARPNYIWNEFADTRGWERVNTNRRPENWRNNINWEREAPGNYIYDLHHGDWIIIGYDREDRSWRTRENNNPIVNVANEYFTQHNLGRLIYHHNMWVYETIQIYNRECHAPRNHVWNLNTDRYVEVPDYNEGLHVFNWRYNPNWGIGQHSRFVPANYVFDVVHQDWILLEMNDSVYDRNWRTNQNEETNKYLQTMRERFKEKGEFVWNNEWQFKPFKKDDDQPTPTSIMERAVVLEDDSTAVSNPDYNGLIPIEQVPDVLKKCGISLYGEEEEETEIDQTNPVYGDYTIKANLKVNGTINGIDISKLTAGNGGGNSYFTLKENDQLYLYKPSSILDDDEYYGLRWDIDSNIPTNLNFKFNDYMFGYNWSLVWDGTKWTGNNCINKLTAKLIDGDKNDGRPNLVVKHSEKMFKWLKETACNELNDTDHFAEQLYPFLTNWYVIKKDGEKVSDGIVPFWDEGALSSSTVFTKDDGKYDKISISVQVPKNLKDDALYICTELNIKDNITELRWDCNLVGGAVSSAGYINTYGENKAIESFNYLRETNRTIDNTKNICIYIEKKFFEIDTFGMNPFDIIVKQQYYEVEPDPRKCTTLTTDYNIYSSKIIWADNIMTMRRDLNVVGGTTDALSYQYQLLRQVIENILEQLRVQALYNEYTAKIQKMMNVMNTVLQLVSFGFQIYGVVSALNMTSDNVNLNRYSQAPVQPPTNGGGGGGGGSGGGSITFPGNGLPSISASDAGKNFLQSIDMKGGSIDLSQIIPSVDTGLYNKMTNTFARLAASFLSLQIMDSTNQFVSSQMIMTPNQIQFQNMNQEELNHSSTMNDRYLIFDSPTYKSACNLSSTSFGITRTFENEETEEDGINEIQQSIVQFILNVEGETHEPELKLQATCIHIEKRCIQ